ncbi:NYN domain-containing protein [Natronoarchaeum rubrum]|uniref:NYN domain-containing protein n=1 Tax=Natronoarchaeum rubrum TaxID=755311 RepID=UPI00211269E7|nr:NYN domain-containing protein [Natronoarchaeum rubrum]HMB50794.1 NYN domain-containing protein [Natronoarchaeum rubrum]
MIEQLLALRDRLGGGGGDAASPLDADEGAGDDAGDDAGDAADVDDTEERPRVGLFVDGPNVLRDEFDVDLDDVRESAEAFGQLGITRLYLDEHATPGLIQAAEARGYEVVITSGDVDVKLAIDASESAVRDEIDVLAIASRDTDFKPVIETAGRNGVRTVAIAPGTHGRSDALRNAANDDVLLGE